MKNENQTSEINTAKYSRKFARQSWREVFGDGRSFRSRSKLGPLFRVFIGRTKA